MSLVSTSYDSLITRLSALLTEAAGWGRMPNAYTPAENADVFLRKNWGLAIGRAVNRQAITCNQIVERTVRVVICREAMFTDSDATGIAEVEKQLLEDVNTVMADFEKNQMLNDGAMFTGYTGDSGIQAVRNQEGKPAFLMIEADFTLRLVQAL